VSLDDEDVDDGSAAVVHAWEEEIRRRRAEVEAVQPS
jgi:hypothetical protein